MNPKTYKTITPISYRNTAWTTHHGRWYLDGHVDDDATYSLSTTAAVRVDRVHSLVETENGTVYHVPGPWPDDLDLPAMRGDVRPWRVGHDDNPHPTLGAYLTAEGAGTWSADGCCEDIIPGVTLDGYASPLEARLRTPHTYTRITHPTARTAEDIARLSRDIPALRAWLLSELDKARAVVGGAP